MFTVMWNNRLGTHEGWGEVDWISRRDTHLLVLNQGAPRSSLGA